MLKWFILSISMAYLSGCTQCDECDILVSEPTVPLQIFNRDSLIQVSDILAALSPQIDQLASQVDAMEIDRTALADSINVLTELIAADSTQYEGALGAISMLLANLNTTYSQDSARLAALVSDNDFYTSAISELELGLTRIDTIYDLDTDNFIVNTDSVGLYNLPLAPGLNNVNYLLIIGPERFDISLSYDTELFEDEKSRVGYLARNIAVAGHSFDSLTVDCTLNCISTNGKIVAYH